MPGLGGSGAFRRDRLDSPRPRSKPLEKSDAEKFWLSKTPEHSETRLERRDFRAAPKPPELPPGFIPARAAVVGDRIMTSDDYGDVVLQVVEQAPWMKICRDIRSGKLLGVLPETIVEVAI